MRIAVWYSDTNDRHLEGVYETDLDLAEFAQQYVYQGATFGEVWEEGVGDEDTVFFDHYAPCQCEECMVAGEVPDHEGLSEYMMFSTTLPAQPYQVLLWHGG